MDNIKIGDKIVEKGRVYRIFKFENKKRNGKTVRFAYFRPYYKKGVDATLIGSIPVKNIKKANIRKPADKSSVKEAKKILKGKKHSDNADLDTLKDKSIENDIVESAKIAKHLWEERKRKEKLAPTKKKLLEKTIRSLSEEFSFVLDKNFDTAKNSVKRALNS